MRRRPLALVLLLITSIALLRDVPLSAYTSIAYASEAVTGYLSSNSTAAFTTAATGVTTLNSTGFILGSLGLFNTNGNNYVAWA